MKRYIGLFTAILVIICSEKAFVGDSVSHIVRIKIRSKNRFGIVHRHEREQPSVSSHVYPDQDRL